MSERSQNIANESISAAQEVLNERLNALEKQGLTFDYLAKKLKRELNAKVAKIQKFKGKPEVDENGKPVLAKGVRVIAQGEKREFDKEGTAYDDGDTVIAWNETAWDVQQKARQDAHKLRGDYPAEKRSVEHSGFIGVSKELDDAARERIKAMIGPRERGE